MDTAGGSKRSSVKIERRSRFAGLWNDLKIRSKRAAAPAGSQRAEGREQRRDGTGRLPALTSAQRLCRSAGSAPAGQPPLAPPAPDQPAPPGAKAAPPETALALLSVTTPGGRASREPLPRAPSRSGGKKESPPRLGSGQRRCHRHRPGTSREGRAPRKRSPARAGGAAAAPGPSRAPPALTECRCRRLSPGPTALPTAPAAQPPLPGAHPRLQTKSRENCAIPPPPARALPLPSPHVTLPALSAASPIARASCRNIAISPPPCRAAPEAPRGRLGGAGRNAARLLRRSPAPAMKSRPRSRELSARSPRARCRAGM